MHIELVTHLLSRFDHKQKELFSALGSCRGDGLNPTNMYPERVPEAQDSSPTPPWSSLSNLLSQELNLLAEKKSGPQKDCVDVANLICESMNTTRYALDHHISCIKLFIEDLDRLDYW
jgi:hypothetical protein